MNINPINYANIPVQKMEFPDLLKEFYKPGMMRQQYDMGEEKILDSQQGRELGVEKIAGQKLANQEQELVNALTQQFGVPEKQAKLALMQAQANHQNRIGMGRPGGGGSGGGALTNFGKAMREREMAVQKFGADSQQVALIDAYLNKVSGMGGKQYAPSGTAKLMLERQQIEQGFLPGSNGTVPLSPEQQDEYLNRIDLQMQKQSTDGDTRKRALFAGNLVQSIDNANVDDLIRYSGPKGAAELKYEQTKDLLGSPSKEYIKYQESKKAVALEAQELRQFLGASITPQMDEALHEMVDATNLTTSPETAKAKILKSRGIIKKQLGTYQDALKSTAPYKPGYNQAEALRNAAPQNKSGMITIRNPKTGETKTVTVQEAQSLGARGL